MADFLILNPLRALLYHLTAIFVSLVPTWRFLRTNYTLGVGGAKWVNFKAFLTLEDNIFLKLVHYPTKTIWLEHLTFDECSLTIFKSSELYLLIYNDFYQQC